MKTEQENIFFGSDSDISNTLFDYQIKIYFFVSYLSC